MLAIAVSVPENTAAQEVKKSGSGICHCSGGQFYDRTTNYTPFENIDACLASGGREPQRGQGNCSVVTSTDATDTSTGTQQLRHGRGKEVQIGHLSLSGRAVL